MVVATIVTARLASSRLPGKALLPLRGRPVLDRLVERLRLARRPDLIALATTAERGDDELAAAATALGVEVYRGSSGDILARWLGAAQSHGIDLLVTCDGDDVFCDPVHVDRVVELHRRTGADYVTCAGLPLGAAPTAIARGALERVCADKSETETEGQARFFADPARVSRATVEAPAAVRHAEARMTLDYPEDLAFFDAVLAELEDAEGPVPSLEAIVALLRRRPDIVAINSGRREEYWSRFEALYLPLGPRS